MKTGFLYKTLILLFISPISMVTGFEVKKEVILPGKLKVLIEGDRNIIESIKKKENSVRFTFNHDGMEINNSRILTLTNNLRKKLDRDSVLNTLYADEIPQEIAKLVADYSEQSCCRYRNENTKDYLEKHKNTNKVDMEKYTNLSIFLKGLDLGPYPKERETFSLPKGRKKAYKARGLHGKENPFYPHYDYFSYPIAEITITSGNKISHLKLFYDANSENMGKLLTSIREKKIPKKIREKKIPKKNRRSRLVKELWKKTKTRLNKNKNK